MAKSFEELVYGMRMMQKRYFKHRDPISLQAAKGYEKQVDAHLASIGKPLDKKDDTQATINF